LPEAPEVLIGLRDGDRILLRNWHYMPEDWITADAELRCGPWNGKLRVWFYGRELSLFAEEIRKLYRELRGTATLAPFEVPHVKMTFTGDGRGGITVDGCARTDFMNDTVLSFQFQIDQTFLPQIANALCAAERRP